MYSKVAWLGQLSRLSLSCPPLPWAADAQLSTDKDHRTSLRARLSCPKLPLMTAAMQLIRPRCMVTADCWLPTAGPQLSYRTARYRTLRYLRCLQQRQGKRERERGGLNKGSSTDNQNNFYQGNGASVKLSYRNWFCRVLRTRPPPPPNSLPTATVDCSPRFLWGAHVRDTVCSIVTVPCFLLVLPPTSSKFLLMLMLQ